MWARNGTHVTPPMDKSTIDAVCIYCPETDDCYYVKPAEHGASVTLRISRPARTASGKVCWMLSHSASWYAQFPAELCESAFVNRLVSPATEEHRFSTATKSPSAVSAAD